MSSYNDIGRRSVAAHQETKLASLFRDVRPWQEKFGEVLGRPFAMSMAYVACIVVLCTFPGLWLPLLLLLGWLHYIRDKNINSLPMNLPFSADLPDPNDIKPGRKGMNNGTGVFFMGTLMSSLEQLWLNFSTLLTHMMVFGTTGAGKTETLVSFATNFIALGGGAIFNDAKAAPKLAVQMFTVARYFGRDDDILFYNYLTDVGGADRDPAGRKTNDSAIFAFLSADEAVQLTSSFLPADAGKNKIFQERAVALLAAIMPALYEKMHRGDLLIDPDVIRSTMEYHNFCKLLLDRTLSPKARRALDAYIKSLSGYDESKASNKQPEEVFKQFGFAQAYFTRPLSLLSDTYGDIFMTGAGEIDPLDVVCNDRILVTLLPSMTKSEEELSSLSKIILSGIKNAMAVGLGSDIEGDTEDTLEALVTNSAVPSVVINDEFAYMQAKGVNYAIVNAQARGLGFCSIIAGQDYAGLTRGGETEAEQFVANSKIKYIMAQEDAGKTLTLVKNLVGQVYTSISTSLEKEDGRYQDSHRPNLQLVDKINTQDLKDLQMGEGFVIYRSRLDPIVNFYHGFGDDDLVKHVRVGRGILVQKRPSRGPMAGKLDIDSVKLQSEIAIWLDHLDEDVSAEPYNEIPGTFERPLAEFRKSETDVLTPAERGAYFIAQFAVQAEEEVESEVGPAVLGNISGSFESDEDSGGNPFGTSNASADSLQSALGDASDDNDKVLSAVDKIIGSAPEETDLIAQEAIQGIRDFFAEVSIDEDSPVAEPLSLEKTFGEIGNQYGRGTPDEGYEDNDLEALIYGKNMDTIASGITRIESALGADDETAKKAGAMVADEAMKATSYPSKPKLEKSTEARARLEDVLRKHLSGE